MPRTSLTALAAVVLLVQGVAAQAVLEDVAFHPPAQAGPQVTAINATWLLIVFQPGGAGRFSVEFPAPVEDHYFTVLSLLKHRDPLGGGAPIDVPTESQSTLASFSAEADFSLGAGSLYLEGDAIRVEAQGARADIAPKPDTWCLHHLLFSQERVDREARYRDLCPPDDAAAVVGRPDGVDAMPVRIEAKGLRVVEWHNADISCLTGECPDGGSRIEHTFQPAANITMTNRVLGFHRLQSTDATAQGAGSASRVLVGAPRFDVAVDGWVRLPLAQAPPACKGCLSPDGQTLQAMGNLTLAGLRPSSGGTMSASLGGNVSWARFDEQSVNPAWLLSPQGLAVVGVAAAATIAAIWVLIGLFSRFQGPEDALLNKRRRQVLEAIRENPGIHYRALARTTGLAKGTISHHVHHLQVHELILERRQGKRRTFFENEARYEAKWKGAVLLREAPMRSLHAWLQQAGPVSTQSTVEHMTGKWGWSTSTAYHRLGRLKKARLVVETRGQSESLLRAVAAP